MALKIEPDSWTEASVNQYGNILDPKTVNQFLLSVVGSDLSWQTEEQREQIYNLASKRMSERCGRSGMCSNLPFIDEMIQKTNFGGAAMPEMTRGWIIPASDLHPELEFEIREPPITEDNLGFKTWGTAFAISKLLEILGKKYFKHVQNIPRNTYTTSSGFTFTMQADPQVLECANSRW